MLRPLQLISVGILAGMVCAAHSQDTSSSPQSKLPHWPPYTAEYKLTDVQTLGDGTTITRESTEIVARDSDGRTVHRVTPDAPAGNIGSWSHGYLEDPVTYTHASWDSRTKQVHGTQLPPSDQRRGCWSTDSGDQKLSWDFSKKGQGAGDAKHQPTVPEWRSHPKVEDLGTAMIQGVESHGRRTTTTIPVGEIGNDRTIVGTDEQWSSEKLGITLRSLGDSPQNGKHTMEIVSLILDEPDPALFRWPEGYELNIQTMHQVACGQ